MSNSILIFVQINMKHLMYNFHQQHSLLKFKIKDIAKTCLKHKKASLVACNIRSCDKYQISVLWLTHLSLESFL